AAIERAHRQPDRPVRVPRYPRPDHPAPTGAGSGSVASARLRGSALSVSTIAAEISVPIAIASANPSAPDTSGGTSTPPCGLVVAAPKRAARAPVTVEPASSDGTTRSGSAAANGMAPSVTYTAPSSQAARPLRRSAGVNRPPRRVVASATASGGVIPAAITAAMTVWADGAPVASPATANV